jgi:pyruvate/2-oxoglutarate dehydrogenase complex dihydrolipoamide dehydrogenase (E3) component
LLDAVRPIIWTDPQGSDEYDILIIGAGAGGLVTAAVSRGLGAKVCLIER